MDIHNPTACEDKEPFALQVIGESMAPEFNDGAVIIIDPGYPVVNGAYVLALYKDEYHFRQLVRQDETSYLVPLNNQFHSVELKGLFEIKGVITQQNHNRQIVHYEYPKAGVIERRESDRRTRKKRNRA
ncbi:MAG: S24 family peptidase [Gammaproteobacteria bacterium]|jgi:SOS-response transcriptional repressor LexA|nr:S24 family peptidase [Gammaproteobacteria bacterium]MBT3490483.1 S24 family peptidase [Gammaproteobacteria bacterium]MBT3717586.1 S24 family peptidase [Gammaproteobacteria bacterium]MBT3845779.1 S24 family peptidase [Gammaproteobacteria bacterium]MBT3893639.1 S24 family peptidase [Gammaproteobacteria bacterium]